MIRLALFLAITAACAFVAAWLADRPGQVEITWLGYYVDTSVAVLIGVTAAAFCVVALTGLIMSLVISAPRRLALRRRQRRAARGEAAISRGLIAVGAGDVRLARRFAAEAARLARGQPLQLLLQAQCAQLIGDRDAAEVAFRAMAQDDGTRLLGLHGLFVEAQRRGDSVLAREFAEAAAQAQPSLGWAGQAAFELRCIEGDWAGGLEALERNRRGGLVATATYRRQRAVLLTARALSIAEEDHGAHPPGERQSALGLALEATKLCPGFVPAAVLAGRLLAQSGDRYRAERILEAAWQANPHPEIAAIYADLPQGASARERLMRLRALARLAPEHRETALALARANLDAHEFAQARELLVPLLAAPTRRVALLMARLEEAERADVGRAREWLARAVHAALDPIWTADGLVAEQWLPVSPATGKLDAFEWRAPVAELPTHGPLIDTEIVADRRAAAIWRAAATRVNESEAPRHQSPIPGPGPAEAAAKPSSDSPDGMVAAKEAELPLRAPDDPGPAPAPDLAPEPEPKPKPPEAARWLAWLRSSKPIQ